MITVLKLTTGMVGGIPLAAASSHQAATNTVTPNIRTWRENVIGSKIIFSEGKLDNIAFDLIREYCGLQQCLFFQNDRLVMFFVICNIRNNVFSEAPSPLNGIVRGNIDVNGLSVFCRSGNHYYDSRHSFGRQFLGP